MSASRNSRPASAALNCPAEGLLARNDQSMTRQCAWCPGPIPESARRDAVTCSKPCRQARHRAAKYASRRRYVSRVDQTIATRRFAYADPPYPGKAWMYRGHPDYAGEVDHAVLLQRLAGYDGWALSTSAEALPRVLALAVAQDLRVRVASWVRHPRPHQNPRYPQSAWEPVIYVPVASAGGRDGSGAGATRRIDVLQHGVSILKTLPTRVVGTKPPAFVAWMFELIGARPGDTFDDLFPGSGVVSRMWQLYTTEAKIDADA